MKLRHLIPTLVKALCISCIMNSTYAEIPLWSFTPNNNFPATTIVSATGTVTIQYTVSNNSLKAHNLVLKPQQGISQDTPCNLGPRNSPNSSCQLSLTINGADLPSTGISGGPIMCQANGNGTPNLNQCYQPTLENSLAITITGELKVKLL